MARFPLWARFITIFVDENLHCLIPLLKKLFPNATVITPGDGQTSIQHGTKDEDWLPIAFDNRWIVITRDGRIFSELKNKDLISDSRFQMVLLFKAGNTDRDRLKRMASAVIDQFDLPSMARRSPWVIRIREASVELSIEYKVEVMAPIDIYNELAPTEQAPYESW